MTHKSKVIRTSVAGDPSFTLGIDIMKENDPTPFYLKRSSLRLALNLHATEVLYHVRTIRRWGWITQGESQRKKKFIQIGCKRFVGVNRTRLIRWARSGK